MELFLQLNKQTNNNNNKLLPDLVKFFQPIQNFRVVGLDNGLANTAGCLYWGPALLWVFEASVVDTQVQSLFSGVPSMS